MNNISIYKRKADLKLKPTTNRTDQLKHNNKSPILHTYDVNFTCIMMQHACDISYISHQKINL